MSPKKKILSNNIDVDNLLNNLKPRGRFQLTQYMLLGSCFVACAASFLKIIFIANVPETTCKELSDPQLAVFGHEANASDGITYKSCSIEIYNRNRSRNETISCINGYTYTVDRYKSFVSEWDLVCENGYLSELSQTLYAVGCFIGAFIIAAFSDKYGRKPAHFISFVLLLINEMALVIVKDYWLFALLRVTEGAFNYGMVMPAYSSMLELFPGSTRTVFAASTGIIWGISMLLMTPLAYVCRHQTWRIVCLAFGLVATTFLFEIWFLEESIRWLVTNNRIKATRKIVKRAAKENGVNFNEVWEKCVESCKTLIPMEDKNVEQEPEVEVVDLGIMTLVKDPLARNISAILVFNSLMNSLTYYGIYMTAVELAGNFYLNFCLTSLMEIFANIIVLFMLSKFERRTTILFFQIFSGVSLILSVIIKFAVAHNAATDVANKILTLLGMFGIGGSFCVIWVYAPEVYPTNLRNTGLGLMGMGSAFGNMIAPFSRFAARRIAWLPSTVFGVGITFGSVFLLTLPETKDAQMPTTMDDVRNLRKKKRALKNEKDHSVSKQKNCSKTII